MTMQKNKSFIFILLFVLIIWPLSFLFFRAKSPETKVISDIVSTKAFLSTLQNKTTDACTSMAYMDRIDVVIVGSSLAYADIDPLILSEEFGGQSVAVCALSGWNTDYFVPFFKYLKEHNIAPARLIWLADDSSHIRVHLHDERLKQAEGALFNAEFRNKLTQKWVETLGTKEAFEKALEDYQKRLEFHSERLRNLSVEDVTKIALETDFASETAVLNIAKKAKPVPQNIDKLRKLCANISQRSIIFDIVIAPGPTTSEEILSDSIKSSQALESVSLESYYQKNVPCVRSIVSKPLAEWNLDNRYFLNRDLRDDYPYDIWENPALFSESYEALGRRDQLRFYDANHLNGVGATIFTKSFVESLK